MSKDDPMADTPTSLVVGLHPGDAIRSDRVLDLGARHPSAHGMLRLALTHEGERVTSAEPLVGSMHRGAEKLFEARDYRQLIMLADRHDWMSAPGSELAVTLAIEHLLGMQVPERATWLRTMLAELNRIGVHAAFLSEFPWHAVDASVEDAWVPVREGLRRVREDILVVTERLTGARLHVMWNQVGGVRSDIPDAQWPDEVRAIVRKATRWADEAATVLQRTDRLHGVGVLTPADVDGYGVTGVLARAAGVARDLRRDLPRLAYGELGALVRVPTRDSGDAHARLELLTEEIAQSADLVNASLDRLADLAGPVDSPLPKVLRPPVGSVYVATENPLGANGYWLVSQADRMPHRLKLRSASFNNVSALPRMLAGAPLADVVAILATTFFIAGDVDK